MKLQINWNAIGISATLACAIHCALMPLLLSSLPLFGISFFHSILFEAGMILLALVIGGISLWHGYRRHHHRYLPIALFLTGMAFLILKQFFAHDNFWLVIPATLFILLAYFLNWKYCRIAKHCHASDCNH